MSRKKDAKRRKSFTGSISIFWDSREARGIQRGRDVPAIATFPSYFKDGVD